MKKKLHKAIAALLILALLLPVGALAFEMEDVSPDDWFYRYVRPTTATDHPFHDVHDGRWYSEAVQFVYENNIMSGIGGNQFNPQGNLTRAAVTALLFRVHNERTANAQDDRNNPFNDVGDTWYAPYVTWAFNHDIVQGTSATTFNPHGNITRQEFAVMVYRYAMNMTVLQDGGWMSAQWGQFADHGQIAIWAQQALRWMNSRGIITGSTATTINPTGTATRAEAAMMMRFVNVLRELEELIESFVLTISVEETNIPQGEDFQIRVELKNNSEEDHEITYTMYLFQPHIPGWSFWDDWGRLSFHSENLSVFFEADSVMRVPPLEELSRLFEAGSTIRSQDLPFSPNGRGWLIGRALKPGVHELRVYATFYLNWGQENRQRIELWSESIILTVQ